MKIIGIDPGNLETAFVEIEPIVKEHTEINILQYGILPNCEMLDLVRANIDSDSVHAIEMIASYGMPVGKTVFETCLMIGRIQEASKIPCHLVYRKDIKMAFCGNFRAKDANIKQALTDRFGQQGTKLNPGRLYGIKKDMWSALAVAVYWWDIHLGIK